MEVNTTHQLPSPLALIWEVCFSEAQCHLYILCKAYAKGENLSFPFKVYGGSDLPNIKWLKYLKYGRVLDP